MKSTHPIPNLEKRFACQTSWLTSYLPVLVFCCAVLLEPLLLIAQTAANVVPPCVPTPAGLENWWPADGNARDIQSARNGSISGNVTSAAGKVGQGFSFDGTNAVVEARVPYAGIDGWTMTAWTFWQGPSSVAGRKGEIIFYHGNTGSNGFGLFIIGQGLCTDFPDLCPHVNELAILYGGVRWYFTAAPLARNAWTHLALVRSSGTLQLFLNGVLAWSRLSVDPNAPDQTFDISARQPYTFNGIIDEVSLFSTPLLLGDLGNLVQAGEAGMCKAPEFTSSFRAAIGRAEFQLKGPRKKDVLIWVSPDLTNWEAVLQLTNPTGLLDFSAPIDRTLPQRYYRITPGN